MNFYNSIMRIKEETMSAIRNVVAAGFAVCLAAAGAAQAEITVGISLGTTGPGASLGIPYKNALSLVPKTLGG